jgi:hypothetical protein
MSGEHATEKEALEAQLEEKVKIHGNLSTQAQALTEEALRVEGEARLLQSLIKDLSGEEAGESEGVIDDDVEPRP